MSLSPDGWNRTFCFPSSLLALLTLRLLTALPPDYTLPQGRLIVWVSLSLLLSLESLFPLLAVSGINCSLAEKEAWWQWRVSISSSCSCWPHRASQTTHLHAGEEAMGALEDKRINSPHHLSKREGGWGHLLLMGPFAHNRQTVLPACTEIRQHNSLHHCASIEKLTHLLINQSVSKLLRKSW